MAGHDDTPSVGEPSVWLKETRAERRRKKEEKRGKNRKEEIDYFHSYGGNLDHELTGSPLSALVVHSYHPSYSEGNPCAAISYKLDFSDASPEPVGGLGNFRSDDRVVVLGSCNGLVALYKHPGAFCLFNPELDNGNGVVVVSRQSEFDNVDYFDGYLFGLCHDKVNDDYKALMCDLGAHFESPIHHLVNFKTRSYICKVQEGMKYFDSVMFNIGTIVEGVPYWICETYHGNSIVKFDPITEELCNIPLVPKITIVESLGALDGKLTTTVFGLGETLEVWSVNEFENGLAYCWTRLFVIPPRVGSFSPLTWIKKEHQVLGICGGSTLIVYSLLDETLLLFSLVLQKMVRKRFRRCRLVAYTPSSIDPACLINSDDQPCLSS